MVRVLQLEFFANTDGFNTSLIFCYSLCVIIHKSGVEA